MKKVVLFLMSIPLILGMMSCSEVKTDAKSLEGKWNITEVNGEKVTGETAPFMEFQMGENKVFGNGGCNTFRSSFKLDAHNQSAISISPAAATMKACLNMEFESKIFKALDKVAAVKSGKTKEEMLLVDADKNVLFVLTK